MKKIKMPINLTIWEKSTCSFVIRLLSDCHVIPPGRKRCEVKLLLVDQVVFLCPDEIIGQIPASVQQEAEVPARRRSGFLSLMGEKHFSFPSELYVLFFKKLNLKKFLRELVMEGEQSCIRSSEERRTVAWKRLLTVSPNTGQTDDTLNLWATCTLFNSVSKVWGCP